MGNWKRLLALTPALLAAGACQHIGDWTRDAAGLDESPVRTEYDDGRPPEHTLPRAGHDARRNLVDSVNTLIRPAGAQNANQTAGAQNADQTAGAQNADQTAGAQNADQPAAVEVFRRAEEYYHIGRLAMRSQCESFMQTLASVDGQTTFGRDLANNFFDTATVAATVTSSPPLWATGLSTAQNSFNAVSGSTERFLLLSESVGALRERVITRMEAAEGTPIQFETYRSSALPSQAPSH